MSSYATLVGNLSSIVQDLNSKHGEFREKMTELSEFMRRNKLPKGLQRRVCACFAYIYGVGGDEPAPEDAAALSLASAAAAAAAGAGGARSDAKALQGAAAAAAATAAANGEGYYNPASLALFQALLAPSAAGSGAAPQSSSDAMLQEQLEQHKRNAARSSGMLPVRVRLRTLFGCNHRGKKEKCELDPTCLLVCLFPLHVRGGDAWRGVPACVRACRMRACSCRVHHEGR